MTPDPASPVLWTPPAPGAPAPPNPAAGEPAAAPPASAPGAVPTGSQRHRIRMPLRSLTARLVAGVVALAAVLVLATGAGTFYALRSFLFDRLDQQVQALADGNQASLQRCFDTGRPSCLVGNPGGPGVRSPQRTWLAVLRPDGTEAVRVAASDALAPLPLTPALSQQMIAHPARSWTVHTPTGEIRVTARVVSAPDGTPEVVASGLSTDEVARTLRRLLELEVLIGAAAILLALVATSYGVRMSLRRLYRVTRTAREVAAELSPQGAGLDRRVSVHEPESEIGQLAESMNTLLAAVETQFAARLASEQRMRQFLADASHELRTPLTSIRGYAELARMQRAQGRPEDDNLSRIESEGTRMSRLVDDLLILARTDQDDAPHRDWVDLADLLDDAVRGVRAAYPARRIDLAAPADLAVVGDRDQLLRVVRNLLTNAAVHTRPDGAITVSAAREANDAVLRVVDAGPGLPPEEAAHVFERFWRADKARSRVRGGSGLGLSIVASAVHAHGGTVHFDSTLQGGSTVTVRLPIGTG